MVRLLGFVMIKSKWGSRPDKIPVLFEITTNDILRSQSVPKHVGSSAADSRRDAHPLMLTDAVAGTRAGIAAATPRLLFTRTTLNGAFKAFKPRISRAHDAALGAVAC